MEILTKITNNIIPHNNFLSDLDRAVLNNDDDKIKYLLKLGNAIYKQELTSNKSLCCNSLNKFIKNHNECINMICFKTSLYYAFIYNNYLTTNIFKFLLNIHNNNYKFNSDYNERLENEVKELRQFRFEQVADIGKKIGRNDVCPCGSGKKYKKCCLK